eukprot:CAMPEP_0116997710 /NCGR_PEP_ID=MMETSP0472-20121206/1047_1 /TAXON_ID=693140 ORGANISM="Tiarina fusus, Strain LIS" /NCGR_SAMPLE_ID=MMETSP0472 /ASSEMBLY_ACC=CAM_ASM_000603 /LENGTH=112 /DNA_ID=CAMNT_0004696665 /DNA_START=1431 /DNA_END=1766 /DNA_ORIENTATION=-
MAALFKARKKKLIEEAMKAGEEAPKEEVFANSLFLARAAEALEKSVLGEATINEHLQGAKDAIENFSQSDFVTQTSEALGSFGNSAIEQTSIALDSFTRFAQNTFSRFRANL